MQFDPEAFGVAMAEAINKTVAPLVEKISALEKKLEEKPDYAGLIATEVGKAFESIKVPENGKDCDMTAVKEMVSDYLESIPKPKDGDPGKSVTLDDVRPMLDAVIGDIQGNFKSLENSHAELVKATQKDISDHLNAIKQPEDGKSITVDDVRPMLVEAIKEMKESAQDKIEEAIKSIPTPENGKDGINLAGAMIDREGALILTLSNGEVKSLGKIVGEDGKDGLSLESFDIEYIDETHEVKIKASAGGRVKEIKYPAGGLRPGGYWRDGVKAKSGEAWTLDGCLWIAKCDTSSKPAAQSQDWFMGARKGRDGEVKSAANPSNKTIKLGANNASNA